MKDTSKREFYRNVRLTASEKELLAKKAEAEGLSESDYIRYLITQKAVNHQEVSSQINDLIYEVNHVGTNINQIARCANAGCMTDNQVLELMLCLREIRDAVQKVVTECGYK